MWESSKMVPTVTRNVLRQPLHFQTPGRILFLVPSFDCILKAASKSPQWGQTGPLGQRCFSRKAKALSSVVKFLAKSIKFMLISPYRPSLSTILGSVKGIIPLRNIVTLIRCSGVYKRRRRCQAIFSDTTTPAGRARGQGRAQRVHRRPLTPRPARPSWEDDEAEFVERSFVPRRILWACPDQGSPLESCGGTPVPPTIYSVTDDHDS